MTPSRPVGHAGAACAHLLFCNWLNYFVYQTTPYDIMAVGVESTSE